MKNTGLCPKCGSDVITYVPGAIRSAGGGNNIQIGPTIFAAVLVERYICNQCGYSEEWIDVEDLKKINKKFDRYKK